MWTHVYARHMSLLEAEPVKGDVNTSKMSGKLETVRTIPSKHYFGTFPLCFSYDFECGAHLLPVMLLVEHVYSLSVTNSMKDSGTRHYGYKGIQL